MFLSLVLVIVRGAYYTVKCTSLTDSTGKIKVHETIRSLHHKPRILIIQVHAPEGLRAFPEEGGKRVLLLIVFLEIEFLDI